MSVSSRFCHACGSQLPDGAQFCAQCGSTVPTLAPDPPPASTAVPPPPAEAVPPPPAAAIPPTPTEIPAPPGAQVPPASPSADDQDPPLRLKLSHGRKVHMNFMGFVAIWVMVTTVLSLSWVQLGKGRRPIGVNPSGYHLCHRGTCLTVDFDTGRLKRLNEPLATLGGALSPLMLLGSLVVLAGLTFLQFARMRESTYRQVIKGVMIANGITIGCAALLLAFMFFGFKSMGGKSAELAPTAWGILIAFGVVASPIAMLTWRKPPTE